MFEKVKTKTICGVVENTEKVEAASKSVRAGRIESPSTYLTNISQALFETI